MALVDYRSEKSFLSQTGQFIRIGVLQNGNPPKKIYKYAQIFSFCLYYENMKSFGVAGKKRFWCISP